jgi:valyl-tRNA synthetase
MKGLQAANDNFDAYKFGDAQQASYSLWLNDLCDVYLELIKPIMLDKRDESNDARWAAQATLWVSIEAGLRLLHPMMPYVTEELWQRLPGRGTLGESETSTIMLAKYPECTEAYKNDEVEAGMATTMEIVKACRSLRASYNINNSKLTHFFIKIASGEDVAKAQADDIATLGKASQVDVNPPADAIPESTGIQVVNDSITVLVDLKGMVDYKQEIQRLSKSLKKTSNPMDTLKRKMAADGYEEKVPEDLKKQNSEKLAAYEKEVAEIEETIANFERLVSLEEKE